jgi:hypothetical protein
MLAYETARDVRVELGLEAGHGFSRAVMTPPSPAFLRADKRCPQGLKRLRFFPSYTPAMLYLLVKRLNKPRENALYARWFKSRIVSRNTSPTMVRLFALSLSIVSSGVCQNAF